MFVMMRISDNFNWNLVVRKVYESLYTWMTRRVNYKIHVSEQLMYKIAFAMYFIMCFVSKAVK